MSDGLDERIRQTIAAGLGLDPEELTDEAALVEEFGIDSLDVIELAMLIETTFGIEIPDDALGSIRTIGDVQRCVVQRWVATAL